MTCDMKQRKQFQNYRGWIGKSSLVGRRARVLFLKLHSYPFYSEKASNVSLKDWEGEGMLVVFERPKLPLGSAAVGAGGREGSYRPINDNKQ